MNHIELENKMLDIINGNFYSGHSGYVVDGDETWKKLIVKASSDVAIQFAIDVLIDVEKNSQVSRILPKVEELQSLLNK